MRTTIEKVQLAVAVGAGLLVLVVAGFLGYAHRRAHQVLHGLPAHLGIDIEKETNGYTYSQSVKGRTVYTIHAATATQHKDGRTGLRDVGIILYGEKEDRVDRISGRDFEYDAKTGVVRALGAVQLDLQAPPSHDPPVSSPSRGKGPPVPSDRPQPMHVTTSGLVYAQRLGIASTDQPVHFEYDGLTGEARGATYNSASGLTTLDNDVRLSGLRDGRPTVLTAAHAEFDRASRRLTLTSAHYLVLGKADLDQSTGQSATAASLVVSLAKAGGLETAEGSGGVDLRAEGNLLQAPAGVLHFGPGGHPTSARLSSGVRFSRQQDGDSPLTGHAAEGAASFNAAGEIELVHLTGDAHASSATAPGTGGRELSGQDMTFHLANSSRRRRWIDQATVTGDARLQIVVPPAAKSTALTEQVRADVLTARWVDTGTITALHSLTGNGHTEVRRIRNGLTETSRGNTLEAGFEPAATAHASGSNNGALTTASQYGNVTVDRSVVATSPGRPPLTTHASAAQVSYTAGDGKILLSGTAELSQPGSALQADRVTFTEASGEAEAEGHVQATYLQSSVDSPAQARSPRSDPALPLHAVGERAVMHHNEGSTTFFGAPERRARLWQGASQVEAPVIVFSRTAGTLDAFGASRDGDSPVRTVLAAAASPGHVVGSVHAPASRPVVLRVRSGRLHYTDSSRLAVFSEGVLLEDADGTLTSHAAVATLEPPQEKAAPPSTPPLPVNASHLPSLATGLQRVVASGEVVIHQPGRVATGAQAVYTAADGLFVLTGTPASPPRILDDVNGSISGSALRFRAGDNSVVVDGRSVDSATATPDGRVHTRTRVKQ